MYHHLGELSELEGINLEPSALAGMIGAVHVSNNHAYQSQMKFDEEKLKNATHLGWATGGAWFRKMKWRLISKNLVGKSALYTCLIR